MAAKNERVLDMVRREVQKNPSVPSQELFEKAKKMDSSIGRLDIRQFHASYPLQVKRLMKQKAGGARAAATPARRGPGRPRKTEVARKTAKTAKAAKTKTAKKAAAPTRRRRRASMPKVVPSAAAVSSRGGRDTVRSILIKFAGEVAAADQKADVVQVLGSMDRYVDQVMRAAARA